MGNSFVHIYRNATYTLISKVDFVFYGSNKVNVSHHTYILILFFFTFKQCILMILHIHTYIRFPQAFFLFKSVEICGLSVFLSIKVFQKVNNKKLVKTVGKQLLQFDNAYQIDQFVDLGIIMFFLHFCFYLRLQSVLSVITSVRGRLKTSQNNVFFCGFYFTVLLVQKHRRGYKGYRFQPC